MCLYTFVEGKKRYNDFTPFEPIDFLFVVFDRDQNQQRLGANERTKRIRVRLL